MKRDQRTLYSPECKECRRWRRMAFYYRRMESNGAISDPVRKAKNIGYIFPLTIQNRHVLSKLDPLIEVHSLRVQFIKTGKRATVSVNIGPGSFSVKVPDSNGCINEFRLFVSSQDRFAELMLPILRDLRIRLD